MTIIKATIKLDREPNGRAVMFRITDRSRKIIKLDKDIFQELDRQHSHMKDVSFGINDLLAQDWMVESR